MSWLGLKHHCKDITRLVSQSQDAPLPWLQRLRVRVHLSMCAACARFEAQMRFLREAARRYKS
jgi:Putative zinc-finger